MILNMIGTTELLLIGGLALLLFGGKKLPEMMRGLGQGVREFKKGVNTEAPTDESATDETQEAPENQEESSVAPADQATPSAPDTDGR